MIRDETQLASPERFRALDGRLYMPSYPWGVDYFSRMADDIHHIGSDTTPTKCEAMRRAQGWVLGDPARSATIRRRRDNRGIMEYWGDTEVPQYKTTALK